MVAFHCWLRSFAVIECANMSADLAIIYIMSNLVVKIICLIGFLVMILYIVGLIRFQKFRIIACVFFSSFVRIKVFDPLYNNFVCAFNFPNFDEMFLFLFVLVFALCVYANICIWIWSQSTWRISFPIEQRK